MAALAAANGWRPAAPRTGLVEQLLSAQRRHVYDGLLDGMPFVVWDRLAVVTTSTRSRTRTTITSAATSVEVDFPVVVRLAVVADGVTSRVGWSHVGPRVDLESGAFNDRFDVYCDDPVRARTVLNPAVMARLLAQPGPVELLLDRGRLTLTAVGALVPPDQVLDQVRLAASIAVSARAAMPRLDDR
jgi:hypothetical protein